MMPAGLSITTDVTVEPLLIAEAKTHLRVTSSADDAYITELIVAARVAVEEFTGRTLATKTYQLMMDMWPGRRERWWDGTREGTMDLIYEAPRWFTLPVPPLRSITSITVYDDADTGVLFASSNYYVDLSDTNREGRVVLRRGATWPPILRVANGVKVIFVAGYSSDAGFIIPTNIKQAIKMIVSHLYKYRGASASSEAEAALTASGASGILGQSIIRKIGGRR